MNIELTDDERAFLLEVVEEKQKRMIQEIDHTDARHFQELLKKRLALLEAFQSKLEQTLS